MQRRQRHVAGRLLLALLGVYSRPAKSQLNTKQRLSLNYLVVLQRIEIIGDIAVAFFGRRNETKEIGYAL